MVLPPGALRVSSLQCALSRLTLSRSLTACVCGVRSQSSVLLFLCLAPHSCVLCYCFICSSFQLGLN